MSPPTQYVAVYTAAPTGVLLVRVEGELDSITPGAYVADAIDRGYWLECTAHGAGGAVHKTKIKPEHVIALQERGDNRGR